MLRQPLRHWLVRNNNAAGIAAALFAQHDGLLLVTARGGNNNDVRLGRKRSLANTSGPKRRKGGGGANRHKPQPKHNKKKKPPLIANLDDDEDDNDNSLNADFDGYRGRNNITSLTKPVKVPFGQSPIAFSAARDQDPYSRPSGQQRNEQDGGVAHDNSVKWSSEEEQAYYRLIEQSVCEGAEMDVQIVKVVRDYALCRPCHLPHAKGKIAKEEMAEYDEEEVEDATTWPGIKAGMLLRAHVKHIQPPDRLIMSLRRVRRVLIDDYQPFTIVIFGLPDSFDEYKLEALMEESGPVEDIDTKDNRDNPIVFVTFLHKEHALAALRRWNITPMPCCVGWPWTGDDGEGSTNTYEYHRIRCKRSNVQGYRATLQNFLDVKLNEKIDRWDETPYERRCRLDADDMLGSIIPYYTYDKMMNEDVFDDIAKTSSAFKFSVKNEPGRPL